jgi:hypothetical protein
MLSTLTGSIRAMGGHCRDFASTVDRIWIVSGHRYAPINDGDVLRISTISDRTIIGRRNMSASVREVRSFSIGNKMTANDGEAY